MKKLFLIRNPEVFQGERYLNTNKDYFEGWYFKNTNNEDGIAFIPGINISNKEGAAFIQVITNDNSYYVDYDINDFEYSSNPFYIKIKNNFFSKENIHIDINDKKQSLMVSGYMKYSDSININTNLFNPNIMGLFSYVPFMECNHAILSMKCSANGVININNKEISLDNGRAYIEKDFGCSFSKTYIWGQGNNFNKQDVSFMVSIADIPFILFNFRGVICSLIIDNYEYRFATYNNTKILKHDVNNGLLKIILKKRDYYLYIEANVNDGMKLIAPVKGKMNKNIIESIGAKIKVTLKKGDEIIFDDTSTNCGLEIVLK